MKNIGIDKIKEVIRIKPDGTLFHREKQNLEFKKNFQFKSLSKYLKTIAAFSNNQGGLILFGVSDSPRKPIGMSNEQFNNIDSEKITEYLDKYFSPEILWDMEEYEIDGKRFGVFIVSESDNKPVICKTSAGKIVEGEIYYRYRGRSEKIKFPEIQRIFQEIELKQKQLWMEHIEQIAHIGPQNISFIDLVRGEIPRKNGQNIVIDNKLLKSLKFVKEYESVEKEGAEALKIIGEIEGMETIAPNFNLDMDFYTTKELGDKLSWLTEKLSAHFVSKMIEIYKLKDKPEYCQHKNKIYYYTPKSFEFFLEKNMTLEEVKEFIKERAQGVKKTSVAHYAKIWAGKKIKQIKL